MEAYVCHRPSRPLDFDAAIPGSKSLTNRALLAAALADGTSLLVSALQAEDTQRMVEALRRLGVAICVDEAGLVEISGCLGHLPAEEADLDCGNSGTTLRFCAALCATGFGSYRLDGSPRMRQRPVGPLVQSLRYLGARVEYEGREGYPPFVVHARYLGGGRLSLDASISSQFISALLLASPCASDDVFIELRPPIVSEPYLRMTSRLMQEFGVSVVEQYGAGDAAATAAAAREARFIIPAPQRYEARTYRIEPDASNACYFLAAPAVAGGRVTVPGLVCPPRSVGSAAATPASARPAPSLQGDARFVELLEDLGCRVQRDADGVTVKGPPAGQRLRSVDADLCDMPDQAQTLAVLALFADGPTTIRNVASLRIKETDRLAALACELTHLGAGVDERPDGLTVHPAARLTPARIQTYNDHRMAMSFALAGLGIEGLVIDEPGCCDKTFPGFFAEWSRMTGEPAAG